MAGSKNTLRQMGRTARIAPFAVQPSTRPALNLQFGGWTRLWVPVAGGADQPNAEVSGRLITTSFMTKVDVMRCIPGKAVSFSS